MIMNPYKYEKKYCYTLGEVLSYGLNLVYNYNYKYPYGPVNNLVIKRLLFSSYGITAPNTTNLPEEYFDKDSKSLLQLLIWRYWDEYVIISSDEVLSYANFQQNYPDFAYRLHRFIGKLLDTAQYTYTRYAKLLALYEATQNNLLDRLQKVIDGEIKNTGYSSHNIGSTETRRDNDTPQDSGDFSDDTHTSFITQGESSGTDLRQDDLSMTNDTTESWDNESIIERLDKIQKLYDNVMLKWLNEFKGLFLEEANVL